MRQERVKSVDEEERGGEKKGPRRREEAGHSFLQQEGARRPTWSSLPPAAVSQERELEKDNAAVEKGCSRNAACLLLSTWSQLGPPDPHTAAPRSLLPSDTAQKAYGRPSPPPQGEQTWPLKAHIS